MTSRAFLSASTIGECCRKFTTEAHHCKSISPSNREKASDEVYQIIAVVLLLYTRTRSCAEVPQRFRNTCAYYTWDILYKYVERLPADCASLIGCATDIFLTARFRLQYTHETIRRRLWRNRRHTSSRNCVKALLPGCSLEEALTVRRMSLSIFMMLSAYIGILEMSSRCLYQARRLVRLTCYTYGGQKGERWNPF